jgi:hypothetical protein
MVDPLEKTKERPPDIPESVLGGIVEVPRWRACVEVASQILVGLAALLALLEYFLRLGLVDLVLQLRLWEFLRSLGW